VWTGQRPPRFQILSDDGRWALVCRARPNNATLPGNRPLAGLERLRSFRQGANPLDCGHPLWKQQCDHA